jgi:hypothetical protein
LDLVGDAPDIIHPIGGTLRSAISDSHIPRIIVALIAGPEADSQAELPEIVNAIHIFGFILGPAQDREQQARQNRDNGNNDEKLNQCECYVIPLALAFSAGTPHYDNFMAKTRPGQVLI